MTIVHYIIMILLILLSIAFTWVATRYYYLRIINIMTEKNQHLTERVKKAENIILHDLLQLSPDDVALLKRNMEGDIIKPVTRE